MRRRATVDTQPALGHISRRTDESLVLKLPVWLGKDKAALVIVTKYADGRITLAVDGAEVLR